MDEITKGLNTEKNKNWHWTLDNSQFNILWVGKPSKTEWEIGGRKPGDCDVISNLMLYFWNFHWCA